VQAVVDSPEEEDHPFRHTPSGRQAAAGKSPGVVGHSSTVVFQEDIDKHREEEEMSLDRNYTIEQERKWEEGGRSCLTEAEILNHWGS